MSHPDGNGFPQPGPWRLLPWGIAAGLLLLPLVAMQFTTEVNWDAADFLIFGLMLVAACGAWELALRLTRHARRRAVVALAIVAAFLFVWAELAVGVFTNLGS